MKKALVLVILLSSGVASAAPWCAELDPSAPDPFLPGTQSLVTYLRDDDAPAHDTRADYDVATGKWRINLKGYLFVPPIASFLDAPAIIYSHGGVNPMKPPCAVVQTFLAAGFVVLAPLRRGEYPSTGVFHGDWLEDHCPTCTSIDYLKLQVDDIRSAVGWIRGRSYVLANLVALVGHSNGGIISMLANRRQDGPLQILGFRSVINISGAGATWGQDEHKRAALKEAASRPLRPVYLAQGTLEPYFPNPVSTLAGILATTGIDYDHDFVSSNPLFPTDAHDRMVLDPAQVDQWAPSALDFIETHFE